MDLQSPLLTIQQISQKLNIPKPTLRFWKKELEGIFVPLRSRGGQRRYTNKHVMLIKKIQELREQNKTLSDIKQVLEVSEDKHYDEINRRRIDLLADRIAQVVKEEVYDLFRKEMPMD